MASYAGFQKYDTPNLGNDAANMLIQKQQMDAKQAEQAKQDAYKNMELGIKLQKEQRDALSANEKVASESIAKVSEAASKIPTVGYSSQPAALTAFVSSIKKDYSDYARSGVSETQKNIRAQQYIDLFTQFQQTGEVLKSANESLGKAKNPDTVAQFVLTTLSAPLSPSASNTVDFSVEANEGVLLPKVNSYQKNNNGELELTQSTHLDQLNAIGVLGNYEAPDYREIAKKMYDAIGINDVDTMQKGGSKKTIVNPKAQENYKNAKQDFINIVKMNYGGDAYMKLVKTPTNPADFAMDGWTDAQLQNIAVAQGKKDAKDANIITIAHDSKKGGFSAKLTESMQMGLEEKLGEIFDNMSPYKVDITTPHTTTNNTVIKTVDSKPMYEGALRGDEKQINSVMDFAKLAGTIYPEQTIQPSPKVVKGKTTTPPEEKTFNFNKKTNTVSVWVRTGNRDATDPDEYQKFEFNLNDKEIARYWFTKLSKANQLESDNKASLPEITTHKK